MRKDLILPALALAGGGAGFGLRWRQIASAFDPQSMLFRTGAPATLALAVLAAAAAAALLWLTRGGKTPEDWAGAFRCSSPVYMTLMAAGGLLLFAAAALGLLEGMGLLALWKQGGYESFPLMHLMAAALCVPAGIAALALGKGNYRGELPRQYPLLATLPAYAALPWAVSLYQEHSRQPELMIFLPALAGVVCAALGLYAQAAFAFQRPRGKLCLFFSLMGAALLLTALADRPNRFFAVMSLACVLLLLGQSFALARNMFGSPQAEPPAGERMPSGAQEERTGGIQEENE
ncbi:MAG: hypothetical protein HFF39_10870 [Lawsonibacter sp.]|nr:hypothetical protein [Lawsonibacter sp.]